MFEDVFEDVLLFEYNSTWNKFLNKNPSILSRKKNT